MDFLKYKKAFFILFCFTLILKLILLFYNLRPIFSSQEINLLRNNQQLEYQISRQDYQLKASFRNEAESVINLSIKPNKHFSYNLDGQRIKPDNLDGDNIQLKVPPRPWGKTNLTIQTKHPLTSTINLLFILSLSIVAVFLNSKLIKPFKKAINISLLVFLTIYSSRYLSAQRNIVFQKTNIDHLAKLYQKSQYVLGQGSPEVIGDDIAYSLSGYHYINGASPTSINFEHPPLAKMLYGLSIKYFGRANIASLIIYLLTLSSFIYLSSQIFNNKTLVLISTTFFITETSLFSLITLPQLDLPLLFSYLLIFIFINKAKSTKKSIYLLLTMISFGLSISFKSYHSTIILFIALLADLVFTKKTKLIKKLAIFSPLTLFVYFASYFNFFKQNTFVDFYNFQKWLFNWFAGKTTGVKPGLIFSTLITGKFSAWWSLDQGKTLHLENWSILWPILLFSFLIYLINQIKSKQITFLITWPFLYMVFLSIGANAENLLITLIPFLILNFISFLKRVKSLV